MQTTDYTVNSEYAAYGAIKSLWIKGNLVKVLSKVSTEITNEIRKHEGLLHYSELYKPR